MPATDALLRGAFAAEIGGGGGNDSSGADGSDGAASRQVRTGESDAGSEAVAAPGARRAGSLLAMARRVLAPHCDPLGRLIDHLPSMYGAV